MHYPNFPRLEGQQKQFAMQMQAGGCNFQGGNIAITKALCVGSWKLKARRCSQLILQ